MEGRTTEPGGTDWFKGRDGQGTKRKMGHTIIDAGTGQGQTLVAGRGGNWRLDLRRSAFDRLVLSTAFRSHDDALATTFAQLLFTTMHNATVP